MRRGNPDNFAFCPTCGNARPAPARPERVTVGRHMRPEDKVDAERNVDDSFWTGLEEALKEEEEQDELLALAEEPEEEEEEEEESRGNPLLIVLLIFAFLLIVFSTVTALILIDRSRNGAQEDVVYQSAEPTGFSSLATPTPTPDPDGGVVVAGIMDQGLTVTPTPAPTSAPVATSSPVYRPGGTTSNNTTGGGTTTVYTPAPTPAPAATTAPRNNQGYILSGSDSRYLTEADLQNLSWEECSLARNEIYARHGYTFGVKALSDYFNSQSWYVPGGYNDSDLNKYERENAVFILEYEKAKWGSTRY